MKLADLLKSYFDPSARYRGEEYLREGHVTLSSVKNGYISFDVEGGQIYEVDIAYSKDEHSFALKCTCPHFEDGFNCKHLWASILETDRSDLLDQLMGVGLPEQRSALPDWRAQINQTQKHLQKMQEHKRYRTMDWGKSASSRVGSYVVNFSQSAEKDQVCLQFFIQERLKKGGLGAFKQADLSHRKIELYEDPQEREFLWDLLGRTEMITSPYSYAMSADRVNGTFLTSLYADSILSKISLCGKLFRHKSKTSSYLSNYHKTEVLPYTYEMTHRNFRLRLQKGEEGYQLHGELFNGEQSLPLSQILSFIEGFVFLENSMAPSDLAEHSLWYELIKKRPLYISEHDLESFLEYFWQEAGTQVPIELPPDIQFTEKSGVQPLPRLSVFPEKSSGRFTAKLEFNYQGKIASGNSGAFIYDLSSREKIWRNQEFEAQCQQQLQDLITSSGNFEHQGNFKSSQLLPVLEKCLSWGWEVLVEDQKVKTGGGDFRINVTSETDWFDLQAEVQFENEKIFLPQLLQALRSGERMITLGDGTKRILSEQWIQRLAPLLGVGKVTEQGLRLNKIQALFFSAGFEKSDFSSADKKFMNLKKILEDLQKSRPIEAGKNLNGRLRGYQKQGLAWLSAISKHQIGGILADDMGLGKTIQVIALLCKSENTDRSPSLVLAPKSLIFNWQNEVKKFAPHLRTLVYTGGQRASLQSVIPEYDLVLTTYHTLRNDIEVLQKQKFNYLILDEAHSIKNSQSQTNMAARLLTADKKIALTGTPVENSLMDLFSILSVVTPGLVSEAQAQRWVKENDSETIQRLAKALSPFILRRTKEQVLKDLPEKTEQVLFCELSQEEKKKYDDLKSYYWGQLSGKIQEKGLAKSKIEVLEALLRLRQAACHQGLLDKGKGQVLSSKFNLLLDQLESVLKENHKVLIFSQFTSLLQLFAPHLTERNINFEYLDGQTTDRAERVENFQTNPKCSVFLLSLKAGGVGLNLTAADYVFILDPWWNPAAEAQAIDRTHRIGQTKKVFSYKIIAKDTVEEKILALQEKKKKIAKSIISGEAGLLKSLKMEDLQEIFL